MRLELKTGLRNGRWTISKALYAGVMFILLCSYFYTTLVYHEGHTDPTPGPSNLPLWIIRSVSVVFALSLGKLWKDKGFLLLTGFLCWVFIRVYIEYSHNIFATVVCDTLLTGLWVFIACYGMGRILDGEQLRQYLSVCAAVWTIGAVSYSSVGIYSAWTEVPVYNLNHGAIWGIVFGGRLILVYITTASGFVLSLSILTALCAMISSRHAATKILYGIATLPMILAISLTDTRASHISLGAGIAIFAGIIVMDRITKRRIQHPEFQGKKIPIWIWTTEMLMMLAVFAGVVFGLMKIIDLFNTVKTRGSILIAQAYAEASGSGKTMIVNRGFTGDDVLNGRWEIWQGAVKYILQNPKILIFGNSSFDSMSGVNSTLISPFHHLHSIILMTILENGLIGLAIHGAFIIYALRCSFRLIKTPDVPIWIKILPAIPFSLLIGDLAESLTWLRSGDYPMLSFMYVILGIICAYGNKRAMEKAEDGIQNAG